MMITDPKIGDIDTQTILTLLSYELAYGAICLQDIIDESKASRPDIKHIAVVPIICDINRTHTPRTVQIGNADITRLGYMAGAVNEPCARKQHVLAVDLGLRLVGVTSAPDFSHRTETLHFYHTESVIVVPKIKDGVVTSCTVYDVIHPSKNSMGSEIPYIRPRDYSRLNTDQDLLTYLMGPIGSFSGRGPKTEYKLALKPYIQPLDISLLLKGSSFHFDVYEILRDLSTPKERRELYSSLLTKCIPMTCPKDEIYEVCPIFNFDLALEDPIKFALIISTEFKQTAILDDVGSREGVRAIGPYFNTNINTTADTTVFDRILLIAKKYKHVFLACDPFVKKKDLDLLSKLRSVGLNIRLLPITDYNTVGRTTGVLFRVLCKKAVMDIIVGRHNHGY